MLLLLFRVCFYFNTIFFLYTFADEWATIQDHGLARVQVPTRDVPHNLSPPGLVDLGSLRVPSIHLLVSHNRARTSLGSSLARIVGLAIWDQLIIYGDSHFYTTLGLLFSVRSTTVPGTLKGDFTDPILQLYVARFLFIQLWGWDNTFFTTVLLRRDTCYERGFVSSRVNDSS